MSQTSTRNRIDAALVRSAAFPAAGEMTSVEFDLGNRVGGDLEQVVVELEIPATTTLVAGKTLTFGVDSCQDDGLGNPADGYGENDQHGYLKFVIAGKTGGGNNAQTHRFRLPPDCARHFMVGCEAEAGAGDNTAYAYTVRLLT